MTLHFHLDWEGDKVTNFSLAGAIVAECIRSERLASAFPNDEVLNAETIAKMILIEVESRRANNER